MGKYLQKEGYAPDLILMDIYMEDQTGIEAARELRRMGNKSRVIFSNFSYFKICIKKHIQKFL